jgi:hypothetical protein
MPGTHLSRTEGTLSSQGTFFVVIQQTPAPAAVLAAVRRHSLPLGSVDSCWISQLNS